MKVLFTILLITGLSFNSIAQVKPDSLVYFDTDKNGFLNIDEIMVYYLTKVKDTASVMNRVKMEASIFANEMTRSECETCDSIPVRKGVGFVRSYEWVDEGTFVYSGFKIHRSTIQNPSPFSDIFDAPSIFYYKYDDESSQKLKYCFFGSVQLATIRIPFSQGSGSESLLTPGIDFDFDGSKSGIRNSIFIGVPLHIKWRVSGTRQDKYQPFIEDLVFGFVTYYATDSEFRTKVTGVDLKVQFRSRGSGMDYYSPPFLDERGNKNSYSFSWIPSLKLEYKKVVEDQDSPELLSLQGGVGESFTIFAPAIDMVLVPHFISSSMKLKLHYTHRFDYKMEWNRPYLEAGIDWKIGGIEEISLSTVYKFGNKFPSLIRQNELMFGLGILLK